MKLLLVLVAVLYVCYGTTTTTTTTTTLKPEEDSAINEVADKSELHDGIDLNTLTNEELEQLADAEDEEFVGEMGKLR